MWVQLTVCPVVNENDLLDIIPVPYLNPIA